MYKVLIVDDEYYIRQRLRTCIEWEDEGFTIGGLAANAEEAFSILSDHSYHLAVIDISMPKKDGLTLIQELRENKIPLKVVILSGYGTFEYAQKAIKYGVTEYLLKPIDEDELIKSLRKIKQELDTEHNINQVYQNHFHTNYLLNTVQKDNYFKKIFTDHPLLLSDIHSLESKLEDYGLNSDNSCRILVFDLQGEYFQTLSLKDLQLYQYAVNNVVSELAGQICKVTNTTDVFTHGVLICEQNIQDNTEFFSYLDSFVKKVKETLNLNICFGCSPVFSLSLKSLNAEYYHALLAYVLSNLRAIPYVSFESTDVSKPMSFSINQILEKVNAFYSSGNKEKLCSAIEALFDSIEKEPYSFFSLDQTLFKLITVCCTGAAESPASLSDDLSFLMGYKELLFAGYNLEYIKQKVIQLFLSMLTQQPSSSAKEVLVDEAVDFIKAHYSRCDINLPLISKNLLISPSYLSTVFKKETGISISQYITQLRMEKSKDFLNNDQLTLTEVAERVGYRDSFYFSKVFKRYFGISPSAYRN